MADETEPKKGLFKKIGGSLEKLIFTHETVEETAAPEAESEGQASREAPQPAPVLRPKKDDALVNTILKSAAESGPALTSFEGYLKTFEGIISDEGSRYKAAFAALAKNESVSVKNLLDAATTQIASLKNEKAEFLESIKEKNAEVDELKAEMSQIEQRIADLQRQIQDLQANKVTKTELSKKLAVNIQKGVEKFDAALAAADEILKSKKNKLQMFLKNM